jgi:hypothetical protein
MAITHHISVLGRFGTSDECYTDENPHKPFISLAATFSCPFRGRGARTFKYTSTTITQYSYMKCVYIYEIRHITVLCLFPHIG